MSVWGRGVQAKFRKDIAICKSKLEYMVHRRDADSVIHFNTVKDQLAKLLLQEDNCWRQRAKVNWLKESDLNTKFFHSKATFRKKHNTIGKLVEEEGVEICDQEGISNVAYAYFQNLFTDVL